MERVEKMPELAAVYVNTVDQSVKWTVCSWTLRFEFRQGQMFPFFCHQFHAGEDPG
jgi:hypothetical protein